MAGKSRAAPGRLDHPQGLAFHGGDLYVADLYRARVLKIRASGSLQAVVEGGIHPRYIAVDAAGNVYVTDATDNRIRKIDPQGHILMIAGNRDGRLRR